MRQFVGGLKECGTRFTTVKGFGNVDELPDRSCGAFSPLVLTAKIQPYTAAYENEWEGRYYVSTV